MGKPDVHVQEPENKQHLTPDLKVKLGWMKGFAMRPAATTLLESTKRETNGRDDLTKVWATAF